MKCTDCTFSFTQSALDFSQALSGGAFLVENAATGLVLRSSFLGTQAKTTGGLLAITSSGLSSTTST